MRADLVQRLVFSPDGIWLLATGTLLPGHPAVALWDVASGCCVATAPSDDLIMDVSWQAAGSALLEFVTVGQVSISHE